MTRDFLKSLGIEDKEIADKIMAEYGKEINILKTQNTDLTEKLNAFNDYEEIKGFKTKYEDLEKQYSDLESKLSKAESKHKIDSIIDNLFYKNNVKDLNIAKKCLNLEDIEDFTDDTADILTEKINALKTDYGYLFNTENPVISAKSVGLGNDSSDPVKTDTLIEKFLERNPNIKREDLK